MRGEKGWIGMSNVALAGVDVVAASTHPCGDGVSRCAFVVLSWWAIIIRGPPPPLRCALERLSKPG